MRNSLHVITSIFLALCTMPFAAPCHAAEIPLGPLSLGKPLPNDVGANYKCSSTPQFSNTTRCISSGPSAAQGNISDILIESSSRKILYAYSKSTASDSFDQVQGRALVDITTSLGGLAPRSFSIDRAVVIVWGDVKLEKIAPATDEYEEIKGNIEARYGLLVDTSGDFKASKAGSRPVYRVMGGDGFLLILSQSKAKQVLVQRLIVAAGSLAERNFKSQADQFLAKDKGSSPEDTSKWPEIAFMIRRLALSTTAETANRAVDDMLGAGPGQKYRSHVWAVLPTSVINHLKDRTYRIADVFGDNTEFPDVRNQMVAQLSANPAEPFSDFLLYALGRFDEAIQFNQRSPIRTVLVYASAHSKLRQVYSKLFQAISRANDRELLWGRMLPKSYLDDVDSEDVLFRYAGAAAKSKNDNYMRLKQKIADVERNRELKYRQDATPAQKNVRLAKRDFFNDSAYVGVPQSNDDYRDGEPSLTQYLNYFNQLPERHDSRPVVLKFPEFAALTDRLVPLFETVLKDRGSPHFDDSAYYLGWLAYHRGNVADAMDKFELAVGLLPAVGSNDAHDFVDYAEVAEHQISRILRTFSPEDALNRVQNSKILSSRPLLWHTALVQLYHSGKYPEVMDAARRALQGFGITIEALPVTTDFDRISDAFEKMQLISDGDLEEIVYLYHASREAGDLETILSNIDKRAPPASIAQIKALVVKYSLTKDLDDKKSPKQDLKPLHRDLRQSLRLVQRALDALPRNAAFLKFREWLHYKRITLLALFDPTKVAAANAAFQAEFPASPLLDDTMAEQVFAEAVIVGDMAKATATFDTLQQKYPAANSIDNAYSWMAIGWTCAGQPAKARAVDQEIIRRFPLTRHARFAAKRLQKPRACSDLEELYMWDYRAMTWRERNRIDNIHEALKASPR
jgi:hypothetical protein